MKRPCPDECEEMGIKWQRPPSDAATIDRYLMVLHVSMISGTTFDVTIDPWTTIREIKDKIFQMKGFSPLAQTLSISSVICQDHKRVSAYTNTRETVADLVIAGAASQSSSSGAGAAAAAIAPNHERDDDGDDDAQIGVDSEEEATHQLLRLLQDQRRAREADDDTEVVEQGESDHEQNESELMVALEEVLDRSESDELADDCDDNLEPNVE